MVEHLSQDKEMAVGDEPAQTTHTKLWRGLVFLAFIATGFLFVASGLAAGGSDFRPSGGSVGSLLRDKSDDLARSQQNLAMIDADIERLQKAQDSAQIDKYLEQIAALALSSGMTEVTGTGIQVTLDDAALGSQIPGVDPNALVVHQQDIQSVVNALWAGGAQAITLQGQRLVSTSGIKCVGSTVVLSGVPYTPPYVIQAVGNTAEMRASLNSTDSVQVFARYAQRFNMTFEVQRVSRITAPAYSSTPNLQYAEVLND